PDESIEATEEAQEALLGPLTVTQNLLPGLANATDLGAASGATPMRLVVTLRRPDPAGEQALLDAEHDPQSPSFHHFLTPSAFAASFGVPAPRCAQVKGWLTGGGLAIDDVSPACDAIAVHGDRAHVDALMSTATHRFSYAGGTFLANTGAPVVPVSFGILS